MAPSPFHPLTSSAPPPSARSAPHPARPAHRLPHSAEPSPAKQWPQARAEIAWAFQRQRQAWPSCPMFVHAARMRAAAANEHTASPACHPTCPSVPLAHLRHAQRVQHLVTQAAGGGVRPLRHVVHGWPLPRHNHVGPWAADGAIGNGPQPRQHPAQGTTSSAVKATAAAKETGAACMTPKLNIYIYI